MGLVVAVGAAAAISVTTVLESVAVVGAVLSVAGAVTHNKTLSMIGMGLGVVGGVGALASSALGGSAALFGEATGGSFAGEAGAVSEAGSAAASGGVESGAFDSTFGGAVAGGAETGATGAVTSAAGDVAMQTPDMVDALANSPNISAASSPTVAAADGPATNAMGSGFQTAGQPLPKDLLSASTDTSTSTSTSTAASTNTAAGTSTSTAGGTAGVPAAAGTGAPSPSGGLVATENTFSSDPAVLQNLTPEGASSGSGGIGGMLGKLADFAGNHPVAALGVLQAGGSLLSGLTNTLTPAQVALYNAQAANNQAAANLTSQQVANMQAPKAVANSTPVTGKQPELVPGYTSLINGSTAPRANITGAPT